MKPFTTFSTAEGLHKGINELLTCQPDAICYDDGAFRIIHIPAQPHGTPVILEPVYILMDYNAIDCWEEWERWLCIADGGEHPNGYETLEEARAAIQVVEVHDNRTCVNCLEYTKTKCDGCKEPLCFDCNQLLNKTDPDGDGLCWTCREKKAGTYDGDSDESSEDRLERQAQDHLEAAARHRDDPIF